MFYSCFYTLQKNSYMLYDRCIGKYFIHSTHSGMCLFLLHDSFPFVPPFQPRFHLSLNGLFSYVLVVRKRMPSCSMPLTSFDLLDLQRRQISRSFSVKALIRMSPRGVQKSTFCWGVELGWGSRDEGYYVSWKSHNLDFWWFYSHMVLGSKGIY